MTYEPRIRLLKTTKILKTNTKWRLSFNTVQTPINLFDSPSSTNNQF